MYVNESEPTLTSDNFKNVFTSDIIPPSLVALDVRSLRATYRASMPGAIANGAKKPMSPRAAVRDASGIVRSHTSATWNPTSTSLGHAELRSHGKKRCLKMDGAEPIFGDSDRLSLSRSYVRPGREGNWHRTESDIGGIRHGSFSGDTWYSFRSGDCQHIQLRTVCVIYHRDLEHYRSHLW